MQQSNEKAVQPVAKVENLGNIQEIDLLNTFKEIYTSHNYSEMGNLARNGQLGATGYFFCSVVDKIAESHRLQVMSDAATKELMGHFVNSVIKNNNKQLTYLSEIRKMREGTKKELFKSYHDIVAPLNRALERALSDFADKKINQEDLNRFEKLIDKQSQQAERVHKLQLESLGSTPQEDQLYKDLQESNNKLAKELMESMVKITQATASATAKMTDALIDVAKARAAAVENSDKKAITSDANAAQAPAPAAGANSAQAPAPAAGKVYSKKPPKPKKFTPYIAEYDYTGDAGTKELSFKQGDILHVYRQGSRKYPDWFKAVRNKDVQPHEKGIVPPAYVKKMS